MNIAISGMVHSLESFGLVDGPGVRYRDLPAGLSHALSVLPQSGDLGVCREARTFTGRGPASDRLCRYRNYWGDKGGITVSGGEPLLQMDFVTELLPEGEGKGQSIRRSIPAALPLRRKEARLKSGKELMKYTDLVMLDIKQIDDEQHKILTGRTNRNILRMAEVLSDMGKPVWIRHVLVPERSDKDEYLHRLADFIHTLKNVEKVEVLPYHTLGVFKWEALGIPYALEGIKPPTKERVENAERILGIRK